MYTYVVYVCIRGMCECVSVCVCVWLTVSDTDWFLRLREMHGPITPHTFNSLGHCSNKYNY